MRPTHHNQGAASTDGICGPRSGEDAAQPRTDEYNYVKEKEGSSTTGSATGMGSEHDPELSGKGISELSPKDMRGQPGSRQRDGFGGHWRQGEVSF